MTDCLSGPLWNMLFRTSRKSMWTSSSLASHGVPATVSWGISGKKSVGVAAAEAAFALVGVVAVEAVGDAPGVPTLDGTKR